MRVGPKLIKRVAQRYAGIREQVDRDELPAVVPRTLSELLAFLEQHQVQGTGPLLIRYLMVDYNTGEVEVDIGVPVAAGLPTSRRVEMRQIPAGTFATVTHVGSYDTLVETTANLLDWARQAKVSWRVSERHNVTRWEARVEHYVVGPSIEPESKNWQTEIAILVAECDS
ncbi:MAG: GyrI-like domain-containing protein [Thermoanaerobaculia bacterium]|nr:GyrI-like domain-containing protein [Thermoanaerobaculia bacterium]